MKKLGIPKDFGREREKIPKQELNSVNNMAIKFSGEKF